MLAMTITAAIFLGGFAASTVVNYVKCEGDSVVQLMMPIISFAATIVTMIMATIGIVQIGGWVTVVIFIALVLSTTIYGYITAENYGLNHLSMLSISLNEVALAITLFSVSTWS